MSQNPQDSNSYDYNPEYGNLNEQNAQNAQNAQYGQQQYQQPAQYGQPMMVPVGIVQKTPESSLLARRLVRPPWCSVLLA